MIDYNKLLPRTSPVVPVPLIPDEGLYLRDFGIHYQKTLFLTPTRITNKFVRCFKKAWMQIPEQDRKTLTDYWKPKHTSNTESQPLPSILFNSFNLPYYYRAACSWGGLELLFDVHYVDYATSKSVVHTIAHELGHALSHPHGWYKQHKCEADTGNECVACECRAYSYMAAWGFDPFTELLPKGKRLVDRFEPSQRDRRVSGIKPSEWLSKTA